MESVEFQGDASGPDAPEEQQPQGERPEGLPEKFNSVVDLAQSYQELEQMKLCLITPSWVSLFSKQIAALMVYFQKT